MLSLVGVEAQTDSLEHPVGDVLCGEQVCLKHQPHAHCIPPQGCGIHRCPQCILQHKTCSQENLKIFTCTSIHEGLWSLWSTPVTWGDVTLWGWLWELEVQQPKLLVYSSQGSLSPCPSLLPPDTNQTQSSLQGKNIPWDFITHH